ncbi:hypothetical protein [Halalkalibacter alkaliphilus]|uniref:Uncharacterized protein n=1 Tax=Halalkalibacter alkaliphilus TaxID=2917993 RepID=A0A9X2I933_9BACI|nr:hypothetical protein [Halalkalibacter alkaliphilus]MCL7749214.1 hypothetical protein [Halalkalibacter alkaliphilus]
MPLPILIGAVAAGAAILGTGAVITAKDNFDKAKSIANDAENKYNEQKKEFEKKANETEALLAELGKIKVKVQSTTMMDFVKAYKQISNIDYKNKNFTNSVFKEKISPQEVRRIENNSMKASDLFSSGFQGISTGVLAGLGATSIATTLGTASTGTLISTLSGAAAQKAALAWLGGGALSAGGLGIAGGTALIGGVVAGPAILVTGAILDSKSEKALTEATNYAAKVDVAIEEMKTAITKFIALDARVFEVMKALEIVNAGFVKEIKQLQAIVKNNSTKINFHELNVKEQEILYKAQQFAQAVNALLKIELMKEGEIMNTQSKKVLGEVGELFQQ